jgi:GT2 family glycosyltransferase
VLLSNDFVPTSPDWLTHLLEPFSDPHVAIAGATLLHQDDTVQHIGVGLENGSFVHLFAGAELTYAPVHRLVQMNREVDTVTGACMAIRTRVFDEVGGLAEGLPLNYNDVDLCLKVRSLGYSIVMVGKPLGYHLESQTRSLAVFPEERLLLRNRWPSL